MPAHINRAVNETVSFANELRADTVLRVRSSEPDVSPVARLAGTPASLSRDPGSGRGSVATSQAKLVIHNYLGISWLETLAMNIPTACFYDPPIYRPRAVVEPFSNLKYLNQLVEGGGLTMLSSAAQIMDIARAT